MKIGMILNAAYPEDIRVTKEATALINEGFEVCLICAKRKNEPKEEKVNGIEVFRIDVGTHLYITTFFDTINAAFWIHPIFYRKLNVFVEKFEPDVLHVHDLPLTNTALKIGKKYNLKVILDMHENFPAGLANWSLHKTNPIVKLKNTLFFNYDRWFRYEKKMCKEVDGIISVVKEMKARLIKKHQISENKIVNVTNNEPTDFIKKFEYKPALIRPLEGKFVLLYIGGFGPHRGLDTAIEGMPEIVAAIPKAQLVLIGKGTIKPILLKLVKELHLEDCVTFIDFQPFKNVFTYMKRADINLIPHNKNEHTNNTIPHKLYQAMMVGQPVLVSDCDPLERIIKATDGGFIFEADNPKSFASEVIRIFNQPKLSAEKAKNAVTETVYKDFNWNTTSRKLIDFYKNLHPK